TDAPCAATLLTAGFAILFLLIGDPIWLIAAANFTYLIGIGLPSVAVWLLRRDAPDAERPYRAPRFTISLGLVAAIVWGASALLGFEQFGLPTVVFGLLMAYSGAGFYAWRKLEDRRRAGLPGLGQSLHIKLTGAMLLVLALDAGGYILAVDSLPSQDGQFMVLLADIFVAVALLTISVGIILPGIIAHSADEVAKAARRLAIGTVSDFARAMEALGAGQLEAAHASIDMVPLTVRSKDELGTMADSFNVLQAAMRDAAMGLDRAREGLSRARAELLDSNIALARTVEGQHRLANELRAAKEHAVRESMHDGLTRLPNRTAFLDRLRRELISGTSDFAVLFVDLDRFKVVNDSLGHVAGDSLLVQVAQRLRRVLDGDTREASPGRHLLARLGGDEFVVLLGEVATESEARDRTERLLGTLSDAFLVEGQSVHCGASIGMTLSRFGYMDPEDMLRDADLAMFKAKSLGPAQVALYHPSMHALAKSRLQLENDMRRALEENEFVLHYQPIVDLATGTLLGFEALVRWQHPQRGLVPPIEFIGVAEENGFIVPLGLWILREACRKAFAWGEIFGRRYAPTVSINLSPRQFAQADLVSCVQAILIETGANPSKINLEITESGTIGDAERAMHVLTALKAFGLQLGIDDFGTGYSSLSYLHRLPVDMLKVDRSFVSGMTRNRESRQVVKTILRLADSLKLRAVAEGVETREQAEELKGLGCQLAQGYLFAKPLPEPEA
ncbi:MAG: EAL domain-containing protein, partial [Methylobacterium mesophilicum]|nr:EAL domain-containing protein [Methylobacterium mesophilicum]